MCYYSEEQDFQSPVGTRFNFHCREKWDIVAELRLRLEVIQLLHAVKTFNRLLVDIASWSWNCCMFHHYFMLTAFALTVSLPGYIRVKSITSSVCACVCELRMFLNGFAFFQHPPAQSVCSADVNLWSSWEFCAPACRHILTSNSFRSVNLKPSFLLRLLSKAHVPLNQAIFKPRSCQ